MTVSVVVDDIVIVVVASKSEFDAAATWLSQAPAGEPPGWLVGEG